VINVMGVISGTGNVSSSVHEDCKIEIGGPGGNTFIGTFRASSLVHGYGGPTVFSKQSGAAVNTRLEIVNGFVRLDRPDQIGDGATVLLDDSGLNLQGHDDTFQTLELIAGNGWSDDPTTLDTGGGVLTLRGNITSRSTPEGVPIVRGRLFLTGSHTFDVSGTEFYGLDLQAAVSGANDITKTGTAALILSGNNTFTGWLFVDAGAVEPRTASALGSVNRGVALRGGTLRLINMTISGESLWATTRDGSALLSLGTATWAGEIHLDRELQIYGEDLTHAHAITGTGAIILFGGTITLASTEQNTFTGALAVRCELLRLNKPSNTRAFSGPLIVGGSASPLHEVRWLNNFQLPPGANVTVNANGLLALNNFADILGILTFNGGRVNLAADSALQVTGSVTSNPSATTAAIDGATGLGSFFLSGTRAFNVGNGAPTIDLQIDARVAGSGLIKTGDGMLALRGPNQFAGAVTINNGVVLADSDNALGTSGNGTTVANGATLWLGVNAGTVAESMTLNGAGVGGTLGALTASASVILNGNVTLSGPTTIHVDTGSSLNIVGAISGTGPLTKTGAGVLGTSGAANSYAGDTLIRGGAFNLNKAFAATAVPGNLDISDAVVRNFNSYQVIGNITVGGGALLDVNGHTENVDILTLNGGGDVQTGAGTLILKTGGALNVVPIPNPLVLSPNTAIISGNVDVLPGNLPINVALGVGFNWTGPELSIPARILSSGGIANLRKHGRGEMRLSGANAFTGALYVNGGKVTAANNSALGAPQGSTIVQTNGTLVLDGGITTGEFLILDTDAPVALSSLGGSNTVTTNINLLRASTGVEVQPAAGVLQVRGRVGSVGGLTKLGPGTLQFFGSVANDYAGLTVISNGVLEASRGNLLGQSLISIPGGFVAGHDGSVVTSAILRLLQGGQLKPTTDATVRRSGLLELVPRAALPNTSARLNRVTGAGRVQLGAGTSLIISNDVSFTFDGSISGAGALSKYRSDTSMHFTGDSTFTGPTTIWEGFYRMDGSAPNSPLTVKADGSLRGDGRVGAVTVEAGGTVNPSSTFPGRHSGDLRMSSANFLAGAILGLAFHGPHPTGGNDSLQVDGPVNLDSTRLSSGFQYAPREGDVLTLIRKTAAGPVTGALGGYPAGTQRLLGNIPVVAGYTGGDGNDVTLTVTNLALRAAGFRIESGNGNGIVDRDECNLILLGLQSRRNTPLVITHAELRTVSSETSVTIAQANYPSVPPLGTVTNRTPFQLRSTDQFQCIGEGAALELHVTVAGEGTFAIPFHLPSGTNCHSNGGGGCESCTVVAGQFTTNTPASNERLYFIGAPSECLPDKPCPGPDPTLDLPPARYLTHSFTNSTTNDLCITAQLRFDCTNTPVNALGVAAYLGAFDPTAVCANYVGDIGFVGPSPYPPFSFRVPAGSNFVIVVTARARDAGCDESYALELFGLPCPRPTLHIAKDAAPDKVLLQWSTAHPGFQLQTTNALSASSPNGFTSVAAIPVVMAGKYTVSNSVNSARQFFRLQIP
jgi:autotransporter-associated beta strand protein